MLKGKVTIMYRHWSPKRRMMGRALMLLLPLVRWWGYSVAAALTGRPGFSLAAKEWRIVWLRRSDWLSGYSRLPGQ
jgi:hypothetical protein